MTQKEFNELRDKIARELRGRESKNAGGRSRREIAADDHDGQDSEEPAQPAGQSRRLPRRSRSRSRWPRTRSPGERELRLATPTGLSNPLVFCVGQLPEFSKPPGKAPNPDAGSFQGQTATDSRQPAVANAEMRITLPAVVNGQIMPGERWTAIGSRPARGQRLVVAASARELIPYLPDAVPGWFQATLALYDAKGKELAYADDYRFHPDPVLYYEIPEDGEYVLEIRDSIYRGREDFVYRITVGELPFVTSIFPLGGPAGAPDARSS